MISGKEAEIWQMVLQPSSGKSTENGGRQLLCKVDNYLPVNMA